MIRLLTSFCLDRVYSHDETQVKSIARLGVLCERRHFLSQSAHL